MKALAGKVALVTGGSRGVGRGIALALAESGAAVWITGRTVASLEEAAKCFNGNNLTRPRTSRRPRGDTLRTLPAEDPMKTLVVLLAVAMLFGSSVVFCQVEKGSWEMSLAATFGSASSSRDGDEGESTSLLSEAFRPGYYVIDGLSIEPELFWTAIESERPIFSLAANASYTFRPSDAKVSPFLLAGYGIGNGIPIFQRLMFRSPDELDVSVLNLGGGVKYFLSEDIGLRAE